MVPESASTRGNSKHRHSEGSVASMRTLDEPFNEVDSAEWPMHNLLEEQQSDVIEDAFAIAGVQVILPKIRFRAPSLWPEAHNVLGFGTDISKFQGSRIGAPENGARELGHYAAAVLGVRPRLPGLSEQRLIFDQETDARIIDGKQSSPKTR